MSLESWASTPSEETQFIGASEMQNIKRPPWYNLLPNGQTFVVVCPGPAQEAFPRMALEILRELLVAGAWTEGQEKSRCRSTIRTCHRC